MCICIRVRTVHTLRFYIVQSQLSAISCQVTKSNSPDFNATPTLLGRSKVETIFIINRVVLWQWKEEEKIFIAIVIFTAESYDYIAKVLIKKSIIVIL